MDNEIQNLPHAEDIVLVGILPEPRDLEIARVLGWYRIPLRYAPKIVHVDFLAFYQPASFLKNHQWQIEYVAKILGVELTYRKELIREEQNHPRADEEYYKLQIGQLIHLPHPISATGWKRITFFYTTGSRFLSALSLNDLIVKDEERDILWQSIRERASQLEMYTTVDIPEFALDANVLKYFGEIGLLSEESLDYKSY